MHLGQDPRIEQLRERVRAFADERSMGRRRHTGIRAPEPDEIPGLRRWTADLFAAGFLGASWPIEYGGSADPHPLQEATVIDELARAEAPIPLGAGALAAAAVIEFGTEDQRREYLAKLRSGEHIWCQLFSEPGAGSDLASLRTRAVRDGGDFMVDGQKVWTTNGQHADMGYLLARTDPDAPKHRGITAFALDMRTAGVDVRPLREITGTSDFNEVFLDSVRIPAANVIGTVNDGWKVAQVSLIHERSAVSGSIGLRQGLAELLALARSVDAPGTGTSTGAAIDDPVVRQRIGRFAAEVEVNSLLSTDVVARALHGTGDAADAPGAKIFFSEVNLAMAEYGVDLQGGAGVRAEGDPSAAADGWWQDAYLYARAYTIAGGSNEVLRNLIAERGLGMPREPKP